MTAINIASSIIYTKDAPLREKIQTFALALIFLFLLYNSSSGLVFYWILNQIFSLCKNIVLKTKHPKRILYGFLCAGLLLASAYLILFKRNRFSPSRCVLYFFAIAFVIFPFVLKFLRSTKSFIRCKSISARIFSNVSTRQSFALLLASCVVLWILCGLVLPSSVIATSPAEFSFLGNTPSPLFYIWSSLAFFAGLFVFWPLVIYKMFGSNEKVRCAMPAIFFVLALCAVANAFLFKNDYGTMNIFCQFDNPDILKSVSPFFFLLPLFFAIFCFAIFLVCLELNKMTILNFVLISLDITQIFLGLHNVAKTKSGFELFSMIRDEEHRKQSEMPANHTMYSLSKSEPNVFILFLDRAISDFFPYILEQFPELKKSFDGFEYYPNCLSFADYTSSGTPAMMGGYDYSIDEINRRSDVLLKDKHNEALMTLPLVFEHAGNECTIFDLPYEDYDSGKNIWEGTNVKKAHFPSELENLFYKQNPNILRNPDIKISDNLKAFSILQVLYPPLRTSIYDNGNYCNSQGFILQGADRAFVRQYARLYYLPEVTSFESEKPTFHFVGNTATHEYTELLEGYVPGIVDDEHPAAGTGFYNATQKGNGASINDYLGYHSNAAALLQVGKWLDYLKENYCYDNTRIIIVADHGMGIHLTRFEGFKNWKDAGFLNPLLLFKDFNSRGSITRDYSLKTNAETVNLALKDLPVSHKNPFTGKDLKSASDFESFNVYGSGDWRVSNYVGKTQFPMDEMKAYTVRDNIFDERNWTKIDTSEAGK